jgi:hypothetical protein
VLVGADEQQCNSRPVTRSFLLEGPEQSGAADDGREGQRSEVAAVERCWLVPVHEEDFAAPNHATALPDGEQATAAVTRAGGTHLDPIDGYGEIGPTDGLPGERQDSFDQRHATREIPALREEHRQRFGWECHDKIGNDEPVVLPSVALGYYVTPPFMRLTRTGMIDVLASDYIRTARAKGLSGPSIVLKHALRNALVPVVALAAVQLGNLLGGSVVIETVFALDGLGYLAYQSISHLDPPVTQTVVTLLSFIYVGLTLAADLVNAWLDPRIRVG